MMENNDDALPPELIEQLSTGPKAKRSKVEAESAAILDVAKSIDGPISLDSLLIGLYRRHSIIKKRRWLMNKVCRMDSLEAVKGRRGVYTIKAR